MANAVGIQVGVMDLDAAEAAEILITLLLSFGNEALLHIAFLDAVLVQFSVDGSAWRKGQTHSGFPGGGS